MGVGWPISPGCQTPARPTACSPSVAKRFIMGLNGGHCAAMMWQAPLPKQGCSPGSNDGAQTLASLRAVHYAVWAYNIRPGIRRPKPAIRRCFEFGSWVRLPTSTMQSFVRRQEVYSVIYGVIEKATQDICCLTVPL